MGLAEIKADVQLARDMILSASSIDELKTQLVDNVLPLLEGITDSAREELAAHDERISDLGEDIEEILDQSGEILHPETAGRVLAVFEAGKILATELEQLVKKSTDELAKKRILPLIRAYRQAVLVETDHLGQITMPDDVEGAAEAAAAPAPSKPPAPQPPGDGVEDDDEDEDEDDLEDGDGDEYEDLAAGEE